MSATEDDIASKIAEAEKLREKVAAAQQKREYTTVEVARDVHAAQLDAEIAELNVALGQAQDDSKVGNVRSGASDSMDSAKDRMKAAAASEKARQAALAITGEESSPSTLTTATSTSATDSAEKRN